MTWSGYQPAARSKRIAVGVRFVVRTCPLGELAKREGVALRQSYLRLAKRAAMVGRYTHAHQFKRARFLRTRLGRIIRDIRRKIEGNTALEDRFGPLLDLALRVRHQQQRQRGPKV